MRYFLVEEWIDFKLCFYFFLQTISFWWLAVLHDDSPLQSVILPTTQLNTPNVAHCSADFVQPNGAAAAHQPHAVQASPRGARLPAAAVPAGGGLQLGRVRRAQDADLIQVSSPSQQGGRWGLRGTCLFSVCYLFQRGLHKIFLHPGRFSIQDDVLAIRHLDYWVICTPITCCNCLLSSPRKHWQSSPVNTQLR